MERDSWTGSTTFPAIIDRGELDRSVEEWREIEGFNYEVSNLGRIRNAKTLRVRKTHRDIEGYELVTLCAGRPCLPPRRVHRLVALAFLGDAPEGMPEVNHIDGNRGNNKAWNLEWISNRGNIHHAEHVNGRRKLIAARRRANGTFGGKT